MKRHVVEIVAAILLCLAAFISYEIEAPFSLALIGTGSMVSSSPDAWSPDVAASFMLHIRWPQFPNLCVGLCTREEYLQ